MSIDNASKLVAKLSAGDGESLALLPKGVVFEAIGAEEIFAITKAANAAGWDFSADELQEAYLDSLALDEDELTAVAGGTHDGNVSKGAKGPGGCSSNYYAEQCRATWEIGSLCNCDDYKLDIGTPI